MARLSRSSRSRARSTRAAASRALPFMLLAEAAAVLRDHWQSITPADRNRLAYLLKTSKGRPMHLTPQQRAEVSAIIKRADLAGLRRDLAPIASRQSGSRRGRLLRG